MRKDSISFCIVLALALPLGWQRVLSQEKPEPPPRGVRIEDQSADSTKDIGLPKITLPEFDIAGNEVVSLNSSSKGVLKDQWQPRNSSVRETPGIRDALTTLGDAAVPGLPQRRNGFTGRMSGGYGSFQTPFIDLWLGMSSPSAGFLVKSGYKSSSGHVENAGFKEGNASIAASLIVPTDASLLGGSLINGDFGFSGKTYQLYGSSTPGIERMLNRVRGEAVVNSTTAGGLVYDAGGEFESFSLRGAGGSDETEVGLQFHAEKNLDENRVKGAAEISRDFYQSDSTDLDPFMNIFSLSVQHPLSESIQVDGGLSFYNYRGTDEDSHVHLYPSAGITWSAMRGLTLFSRFSPYIQRVTLSRLIERAPYISKGVQLRHPDFFANLVLGASGEFGRIQGDFRIRYQQSRNIPLFVEEGSSGVWDVQYLGTTTILGFEGEVSSDLTEISRLTLSFLLQETENSETGQDIPYFPGTQIGIQYRHDISSVFTVSTGVQVRGSQFTDLENTNSLSGFLLWDAMAEYEPMPHFFVGLSLENILEQDQDVWRGYAGLPRTVTALARYNW